MTRDLFPLFMIYRRRGLDPLSSHWAARRDYFNPRKLIEGKRYGRSHWNH